MLKIMGHNVPRPKWGQQQLVGGQSLLKTKTSSASWTMFYLCDCMWETTYFTQHAVAAEDEGGGGGKELDRNHWAKIKINVAGSIIFPETYGVS